MVLCIQEAVLFGWITVCPSNPLPQTQIMAWSWSKLITVCHLPPKKTGIVVWSWSNLLNNAYFCYDLNWHLETPSHLNCPFYVVFLRSDFVGFILKTEWLNTEWGRKDFYFLRFLKSRQLMSLAFLTGVIQNSVELNTEWVKFLFIWIFFSVVNVVLLKMEVLFHNPHAPKNLLSQWQWSWNLLKYRVFSRYGEGNFNNIWEQHSQKEIDWAFYQMRTTKIMKICSKKSAIGNKNQHFPENFPKTNTSQYLIIWSIKLHNFTITCKEDVQRKKNSCK